jgi:XTP/dITP diphosphohydrolase
MRVILASNNIGKIHEFRTMLEPIGFEIVPQVELNVPPIPETGLTFVENALIKARHAAAYTRLPAISDDSGLVVPALHGAPGIYSARYAGQKAMDGQNNKKLLLNMENLPDEKRQAYFYCALVFIRYESDPVPLIACGQWQGSILRESKGDNGFGYDPIFYVPERDCSAAELTTDVKNQLSHRALALKALLEQLK